jgi:tRNA (guanine-N7-)-methyltransferase
MREFPTEYHQQRGIQMYPETIGRIVGDFLEIGPGRGDLLLDLAARYPHKAITGIELAGRRYFKLIRRLEKRNITNVRLVWAPAQIVVPSLCAAASFERIYVLFPDPWPKKRHLPHRLLTVPFLAMLAELLSPSGSFFFATDFQEYALWVVENLKETHGLEIQGAPFTRQDDVADYFPTFFEQKWRDAGREIFYLHCRRP